jgi:uncharacterized membrane protein YedE/YeeE
VSLSYSGHLAKGPAILSVSVLGGYLGSRGFTAFPSPPWAVMPKYRPVSGLPRTDFFLPLPALLGSFSFPSARRDKIGGIGDYFS